MFECFRGVFLLMCAIGMAKAVVPDGLQTEFFSLVDKMIKNTNSLELMDGVSLVKTSEGTPRSLNGEFGVLLLDRFNLFVNTHAVRVDLAEPEVEGRGKKIKIKGAKNYLIPLIIGIKAKMVLLSAMVGNTIAVIAAKAILVSKIALILGIMLFLKKLVTSPPKNIEHEHIKHRKIVLPTEEVEFHHSHERWEKHRSDDGVNRNSYAHDKAYRQQRPNH